MADFTIKAGHSIWRHGRIWYPGEEEALEEAGFSEKHKAIKARNSVIDWHGRPAGEAPEDEAVDDEVNASEGALALAEAKGLDLAALVADGSIIGTGPGGRIYKGDVEQLLKES